VLERSLSWLVVEQATALVAWVWARVWGRGGPSEARAGARAQRSAATAPRAVEVTREPFTVPPFIDVVMVRRAGRRRRRGAWCR
jgi:hypothetical protein